MPFLELVVWLVGLGLVFWGFGGLVCLVVSVVCFALICYFGVFLFYICCGCNLVGGVCGVVCFC